MGELGTGIEVYDHQGKLTSVDMLKRHDLLIVYFKTPLSEGSMSTEAVITQNIQGTVVHLTLIDFERLGKRGLEGRQVSWFTCLNKPLVFPWGKIEKIHMAGYDSTGRVMMFVEELFRQKAKAEQAAERMRANIDALKA